MISILLVDSSVETLRSVKEALGPSADISVVHNQENALNLLRKRQFQMIISEITLPGLDGFKFCALLKTRSDTKHIPFVFLTTHRDTQEKVMAFTVGASDYVVKPLEPLEFKARIESKIVKQESFEQAPVVEMGLFSFHVALQRVSVDGQQIKLTPNEFKLLYFMATHESHVLTRNQLLQAIWGSNAEIFDRTIDAHVASLRRKLGPYGSSIETVHGVGYTFTFPTTQIREKAA
ncbi:MAG: response regulator transcription factor [Bacteriovoracia bacterium]